MQIRLTHKCKKGNHCWRTGAHRLKEACDIHQPAKHGERGIEEKIKNDRCIRKRKRARGRKSLRQKREIVGGESRATPGRFTTVWPDEKGGKTLKTGENIFRNGIAPEDQQAANITGIEPGLQLRGENKGSSSGCSKGCLLT